MVGGRRIKRKLDDPRLTTKKLAEARAREIVMAARAGRWAEIDATKSRQGMATIGEVLATYMSTDRLQVSPKVRANNARNLRLVIRQGFAHLGRAVRNPDTLPADVLTWELMGAFKAWRLANSVPRFACTDTAPVAGNLKGADLQRMMRSANHVILGAKRIFTKEAMHPLSGAYLGLTLPDLGGFLAERKFVTNEAAQYIPPDDEIVTRIVEALPALKAGQLTNAPAETPARGFLSRRPRSRFWVARWRPAPGKWRTRSTRTEDKIEAQNLADQWAAAEGYCHHDKRLGEPGGFFILNAPGSPRGRGRRINQPRAFVAMALALELGLRLEEIAEARWSQVSRVNGELIFHATSTESYKGTKGRVDRVIPFPEDLFAEVEALKESGEFLIGGSPAYRLKTLPKEVAGVMRFLGWNRVECLHELRKIFASDYGREVKDPTIVKDVLGHKSLATTMRYLALNRTPPKMQSRRVASAA